MKKLLLPMLMFLFTGCFVQKQVSESPVKHDLKVVHVQPFAQKGDTGGVYYNLPRTVICIDLELTCNEFVKGPYAAYASKYLGLNAGLNNSTTYEVRSLKISTISEPDPQQLYFVSIPRDEPTLIELSQSGLLIGFNASTGLNPAQPSVGTENINRRSIGVGGDMVTESNLLERVDTVIEFSGGDSLREQRVLVRRTLVEKSLEQRAKEAADEIFKLQENKLNLVTGFHEVNYSYETMRFMYEQLDKAEQELTRMFTGYQKSTVISERFVLTPGSESFETNLILARFSPQLGLLPSDVSNGTPLNLQLRRSHNNLGVAEFELSGADSTYTGLAYRIPGFALVKISLGQEMLLESSLQVNQFGVIARLSPGTQPVLFHPQTGSIRVSGRD
jgi:hypothetical protein